MMRYGAFGGILSHKAKLAVLDTARGLMALWVMLFHISVSVGFEFPVLRSGPIAVDVFMFISGLLMTYNFLNRAEFEPLFHPNTWKVFYMRRFLRIAPLYYLCLLVALVFNDGLRSTADMLYSALPLPSTDQLVKAVKPASNDSLSDILLHVTFLFGLFPKHVETNALPDWSLSLEMQFYLIVPVLVLSMNRIGLAVPTIILVLLNIVALAHIGVYLSSPKDLGLWPQPAFLALRIAAFVIGILFAYWIVRRQTSILLAALCISVLTQHVYYTLIVMAVGWAMEKHDHFFTRTATSRPLRYLGDISYGIYLIHMLILYPVGAALLSIGAFGAPPAIRFAIALVTVGIPVIALSGLAHRWIEMPMIAFGRNALTAQQPSSFIQPRQSTEDMKAT
jgi:peptidoglycan/LPS O-acetylase OafA/YrhL